MEINLGLPNSTVYGFQKKEISDSLEISSTVKELPVLKHSLNIKDVKNEIDNFNKYFEISNTQLQFSLHEGLNEYYVAIVDGNTNEVIKEIPPKKLLDMRAAVKETIGLFIDRKI
ncbi:flagellar protein FlaG [Alkalihalobacillus sp. MEB130]|uniref:flagellar protein FlaG n=1 Tax=Alkalihalobacillus sp. MEB130 TaxID=2976704 RepID=UPI0028DD9774|nr:flagellar protein FlaG [Alkalihalobacillus sp. MEB130]MDT8858775.1 flagellar protein FlaG [Alkalihalobacillus sp. MEB130]